MEAESGARSESRAAEINVDAIETEELTVELYEDMPISKLRELFDAPPAGQEIVVYEGVIQETGTRYLRYPKDTDVEIFKEQKEALALLHLDAREAKRKLDVLRDMKEYAAERKDNGAN